MNKTVVFTIAIGNLDYFKYTLPTIVRYAINKTGSDFVILDSYRVEFKNIYFEKFYLAELLEQYKRVLYVDADIIITPGARNIFKLYHDENVFYAYNENEDNEIMGRDMYVEPLLNEELKWGKINNKYQYFNAGVMLVSKKQKIVFEDYKSLTKVPHILDWDIDQTLLNYSVVKNDTPFETLDYSFNRMFLGKEDNENERYKADFIHYAGDEKVINGNKIETIKNDYKHFYHA